MAISVRVEGLDATVKAMHEYAREMGVRGGPMRGALFAAAKVIRDEAQRLAPVGRGTPRPGNLRANVFIYRDRNPRDVNERYIISVRTASRRRKANVRFGGAGGILRAIAGGDAWYWHFVEFGTAKQAAQPFLRPAFETKGAEALAVFTRELQKGVAKVEERAKRRAGVRA